mgnify:CR=1 FL=1
MHSSAHKPSYTLGCRVSTPLPSAADVTNPAGDTIALNGGLAAISAPPQLIGGWLVQRKLGAGAMGEVFLAQRGEQRAALKLVAKRYAGDESFTTRFQREIALLSKLNHPHVARAFDGGEHEGRPWLAMEFVNGPDLEGLLKEHGPFFESDVLQLAIQVGRGLEHIHEQAGLIHRDIKPANILVQRAPGGDPRRLLNRGDEVKLIDFGLAKPAEQDEGNGLTMTGMIMGTPNYIAPEQVACERQLTLHVDMYALGASMFHLLTGRVPFESGSAAAVMAAHLNSPIPDPGQLVPVISPATRKLIMTTLGKRASDRFRDWSAFNTACEKALAVLGETAPVTNRFLKKPMTKPPSTLAIRKPPSAQQTPLADVATPSTAQRPPGVQTSKLLPAVVPDGGRPAMLQPGSAAALAAALGVSQQTGSEALRAVATSRIIKNQSGSGSPARSGTAIQKPGTGRTVADASAVQKWSGRLEKAGTTGGSILPWLALGAAGLLAIAGAIWALSS